MSLRRKNSKMGLLEAIPIEFFRIIFRAGLIIVFLNLISVIFAYNQESFPVAVLALFISLIPCIGSYVILKRA